MMRNVVVESNPVAQYFISGWGTLGLVWFKIAMVTIIVSYCTSYCDKKTMAIAQYVLNGSTLFVGSVVAYSAFLLFQNQYINSCTTVLQGLAYLSTIVKQAKLVFT